MQENWYVDSVDGIAATELGNNVRSDARVEELHAAIKVEPKVGEVRRAAALKGKEKRKEKNSIRKQ